MPLRAFPLAFALSTLATGGHGSPRAVVTQALRAVNGDSVTAVAQGWQDAVAADPHNRLAALGLATVARLTYHYADADREFAELLSGTSAAVPLADTLTRSTRHPDGITVYAALGYAWSLDARGLEARADSAFVRARRMARAIEEPAAASEALIGLSVNRAAQRGIPVGFALLDTAARLAPGGATDLETAIAVRRALFATVLSRPQGAAAALAAAALARRANEPREEARALRARALGLEFKGELDSAAGVLTTVEQIERRVHDRATLAETLMRHADTFHNRGDIGPFKQYVLAAQAEGLASQNLYALAASNIGLGSVSLLLNDLAAASDYLDRAAAQYDTMQDQSGFAQVRSYRADLAVQAGQWAAARNLAIQARDFDRAVGDYTAEFEEWRDLIEIDVRAADMTGAEQALAGAEELAHRRHQRTWDTSLEVDRGRLALGEGRPSAAASALTRYLQTLDSTEHVVRFTARALLAEAEVREGFLDRADLEITAAEDELDAWRATLTDRELRPYVFQVGASEVNDRDAATSAVLASLAVERPKVAFALAERRRARDLADRLVRLAALRDEAVDTSSKESAKPPGSRTLNGDVAARATAEQGAADSVAAVLPDEHTALLEFVTGAYGAPTTVFVVTRAPVISQFGPHTATIHAYRAPSADSLAEPIERFVALLESGNDAAKVARAITAATLDTALRELGPTVTHLIVVPDGPLYRVPFDALRTPDGVVLGSHYTITTAPSAAVLRALWRRPQPVGGDRRPSLLLALADPTLSTKPSARRNDPVDPMRDVSDTMSGLQPLTASAQEARLVASYAPRSDVRLGSAASAAYLLHAPLDRYRVIHIATHALVDERSVARTALVLAPGDGETGFVTPAQLASLHLDADLVVLSACRTAGGVVVDGDGVQGLTGPLLAAGARAVVATQWRVGDRAIVPIVEAFYAAMARGLPVGDALAAAKREAIARGERPADWAAFTVVGDPLVRPPLRSPGPRLVTVIGWVAVVVVLTGLLMGAARRERRESGVGVRGSE